MKQLSTLAMFFSLLAFFFSVNKPAPIVVYEHHLSALQEVAITNYCHDTHLSLVECQMILDN